MADRRALFKFFVIVVLVYAAIFPLLTVDTLMKLLGKASIFEAGNLLLLVYLELGRLITSIVGIGLAIYLLRRASSQPDARALALFLLFSTITYEKAFGGSGYPGDAQQKLVTGLLEAGMARGVLTVLFGPQAWTLWPAAAALLRFSAVFPRPLEPATLAASGADDRRGMLRGSGVAGADIGGAFRSLSQRLLGAGAFATSSLIAFALIMIAVHAALLNAGIPGLLVLVTVAAIAVCIAVTNIRAAYVAADGTDRVRATWIAEGFVIAVFMFLVSTALLALAPATVTRMLAFVLIMLLPAAVMACLTISVLDQGELDSGDAIAKTVRLGTVALAVAVVFGVLFSLLGWLAPRFGISHALASGAAVVITAIGFPLVSKTADRIRSRILERPDADH
jgi:hypothetical protein